MTGAEHRLKIALLVLGAVHLIWFCTAKYGETIGIADGLYPDGTPVGGDFINQWIAAKLILADRTADIYQVHKFMASERTFAGGAELGLRLWAYPPLSLLFVWPFGLLGYYAALAVWSAIGLTVLTAGARRFGFDHLEIAILLTSPATLLNLYFGQTGSLATGLFLLALSARPGRDTVSATAGALLAMKPQAGFLLPLLWAFQGHWRMIAWTAGIAIGLIALAAALFGPQPWRDYLNDTLPTLAALERAGSGPFMTMIPSMFMALRIVTGNSTLAFSVHAGFAALVLIVLVIRVWQVEDGVRRSAMVLIATVLMTPYLHNYDLALLLCGALLMARRLSSRAGPASFFAGFLVIAAWALPQIVVLLNTIGAPISPLLILPLLLMA